MLFKPFKEYNNVYFESMFSTPFNNIPENEFFYFLFNILSKKYKYFNDFTFFIFSGHWKEGYFPKSANLSNSKKILIYISEEHGYIPYYFKNKYYIIFKTYMNKSKFDVNNIFNFPLQCVSKVPKLPYKNIIERKYSVFFSGNLNINRFPLYFNLLLNFSPPILFNKIINYIAIRNKLFMNILIKKKDYKRFPNSYIRFTDNFLHGITREQYGKNISDSKIVLCPKGFISAESYRHYEAMRAGCVIISEKLPNTIFYINSPIIQINNWKEGLKKVKKILNNTELLSEISKKTLNWYNSYCNENATANYMINCININEKIT